MRPKGAFVNLTVSLTIRSSCFSRGSEKVNSLLSVYSSFRSLSLRCQYLLELFLLSSGDAAGKAVVFMIDASIPALPFRIYVCKIGSAYILRSRQFVIDFQFLCSASPLGQEKAKTAVWIKTNRLRPLPVSTFLGSMDSVYRTITARSRFISSVACVRGNRSRQRVLNLGQLAGKVSQ